MIPRVFHRIWLGGDLPPDLDAYGQSWLAQNPEWTLETWTERELNAMPMHNAAAYHAAAHPVQKADIASFEILHRHGGVYLDCDFEALRPFGTLLDNVQAFVASEDGVHLSHGIMGSVPGHPFFELLISELPAWLARAGNFSEQSGPIFMTAVSRRYAGPLLIVFPPAMFYPYPLGGTDRSDWPHAVGVHHWRASWL